MRLIKLIILIFIITSCKSTKQVSKLYGKCCTQILINSNNTFEYHSKLGVGSDIIRKGTWKKHNGDTILLNTYNQPKNNKVSYIGKVNPYLKNILRISIRDINGKLGGFWIEINDGEKAKESDTNGIVEFEIEKIRNITYSFIGINEDIEISNSNYNDIDILIPDLDLEIVPEYFTNQPMIVTKRKVIFNPNKVEERFERKRTNINKKYWE